MEDIVSISETEELDNDTQMEATSGCESPVIAQTQKTRARERERSKSISTRGRCRVRPVTRERNLSSSPKRTPKRTRVSASNINTSRTRSRSPLSQPPQPPETPPPPPPTPPPPTPTPEATLNNRERGSASRQATIDSATNALDAARGNRSRSSTRSPTRSRSNSPGENQGTPGDPILSPRSRQMKRGRKKTSVIWKHMVQRKVANVTVTYCNHCDSNWVLSGSTSTALQHLRNGHIDKLTTEELRNLNSVSEPTSRDATTPKRQLKGSYVNWVRNIDHNGSEGRELNRMLCLAILSGSLPWNILDNVQFAMFVEKASGNRYKLPSRTYMTSTIVPRLYQSCRDAVTDILKKIQHIAFTTDAWRSFHKDSYITITAHVFDDDLTLHSFVLDTSEITERHTADNLFKHIDKVLKGWDIQTHSPAITLNYNNTDENDIYADAHDEEDVVDFLRTENIYDDAEETTQTQMFESQSQTQIDEILAVPNSSRSDEQHTGTEHRTTFISDNASDITKALTVHGKFEWYGCAGHHLNLIVRIGFKKNQNAANLLNKCKAIVRAVNYSQPVLYDVRKYQDELDIPISAILQEITTRWWSILHMLISIIKNVSAITLALVRYKKKHLIITEDDQLKIKELITLLTPFKQVGEVFGMDRDITITSIVPMFMYLKQQVLMPNISDSAMIKDMKTHMLIKLGNRYSPNQWKFLQAVTVLDPRVKSQVICPAVVLDLKSKIKEIAQSTVPDIIPPTQNQEYHNLQSTSFTTPPASSSPPDGPSHSHVFTKDTLFDSVYNDDSDDDVPSNINQLDEKIDNEFNLYRSIKITSEQKKTTNLITWWKQRKGQFPCLFQAVKGLLSTPATSVPSERIFSEAGYIARARRSRIIPQNLNKFLFIKKKTKIRPRAY